MIKTKNQSFAWEKIIALTVVGVFCVFGLISWIVSSNYALDLRFSEALDNGMKYKFIRFWTMFRILDGYEAVVTFMLPMVFILAESFLLAMKKARPHGWFAHHYSAFTWVYLSVALLWTIGISLASVNFSFGNQGFGHGYWYWFQTGWSYLIPGFILSLTIQLSYLWTATWYVHWKLARRVDFLANQYWKRTCVVLLTIGVVYIPIAIFKAGLRREYLYNIRFADFLTRLKTTAPDRLAAYLNQDAGNAWNQGFNPDAYTEDQLRTLFGQRYLEYVQNQRIQMEEWVQNWNTKHPDKVISLVNKHYFNFPENSHYDIFNHPRTGTNYFDANQTYPWYRSSSQWGWWGHPDSLLKEAAPLRSAFPSGHMAATFGICLTVYIFKNDRQKSVIIGRRIGFVLGLIYYLDMFFSLAVSLGHWWSDLGFTLFWSVPSFFIAWGITNLLTKVIINPFFKWAKQGKRPSQKLSFQPHPTSPKVAYAPIKPYCVKKSQRYYLSSLKINSLDAKKLSQESVRQIKNNSGRRK